MYLLTKEEKTVEGTKAIVYGIRCDKIWVRDVSTDKAFAENFIRLCNEHKLSPCQLEEVVTDMVDT